jgi:hypothetical protein
MKFPTLEKLETNYCKIFKKFNSLGACPIKYPCRPAEVP